MLDRKSAALLVKLAAVGCLGFGLLLSAGCGPAARLAKISGEVTLDGEPLTTGTISFEPVDGKTSSAGAMIVDGKYEVEIDPGRKWVRISSPRVVRQEKAYDTPDSPVYDVTVEALPARYNVRTELEVDVQAGANQHSFPVTSK